MLTDKHTSEMVWMWTINELYRKVALTQEITSEWSVVVPIDHSRVTVTAR